MLTAASMAMRHQSHQRDRNVSGGQLSPSQIYLHHRHSGRRTAVKDWPRLSSRPPFTAVESVVAVRMRGTIILPD